MRIIVTGLSHKRTPIQIREKVAFDSLQTVEFLTKLRSRFPESEFVLLSTCNRVELYCATGLEGGVTADDMAGSLSDFHNIKIEEFRDFLYVYNDEDAVRHLLSVASSLDSMVVGEDQIIRQVKEGYTLACSAQSAGKILNRLFHCAFATSKKIFTNTLISSGRVSVAGVAVELAKQLFADIVAAKVVVIGAGEMGELLLQHLLHAGCRDINIVNRSYDRGMVLADKYHVAVQKWETLAEQFADADIAISSVDGGEYLFNKESFEKILTSSRRNKPLLIIDISVPRSFEPSVNKIENVYLYSVDELSEVAEQNRKARKDDITAGRRIVRRNAIDFIEWFNSRDLGLLIGQMKEKFGQISQNELDRFLVRAGRNAPCRELAKTMVDRIVNKLLHCVIAKVNVVAKEHGPSEAVKLVDSIVRHAEEILSETFDKESKQQ